MIGLAARCWECLETGQGRLLIGPQVANLPHNRRFCRTTLVSTISLEFRLDGGKHGFGFVVRQRTGKLLQSSLTLCLRELQLT